MGIMVISNHKLLFGARMTPNREGGTHLDLPHSHFQSVESKKAVLWSPIAFLISLWGKTGPVQRHLYKFWRCESQLEDVIFYNPKYLLCSVALDVGKQSQDQNSVFLQCHHYLRTTMLGLMVYSPYGPATSWSISGSKMPLEPDPGHLP